MKLQQASRGRGITAALVLPWLLAAAGVTFGAVAWSRSSNGSASIASTIAGSEELKSLRLALVTSDAEKQALRRELDRLRPSRGASGGGAPSAAGGASEGDPQVPEALQRELANRLEELLAMSAAGDERAKAEAGRAIFDLLRGGAAAFTALRDVYLKTADAKGRNLLLGSMIFSGSPQTRDFIFDQVQTEKDPELHRTLVGQAAAYATDWQTADTLKASFIDTLSVSDDPASRAAATRGLRYAPGDDAGEALRRASSDPSDEVRLAAVDTLAFRPGALDEVRQIAATDPSPRVREFAQCRLVVAQALQ